MSPRHAAMPRDFGSSTPASTPREDRSAARQLHLPLMAGRLRHLRVQLRLQRRRQGCCRRRRRLRSPTRARVPATVCSPAVQWNSPSTVADVSIVLRDPAVKLHEALGRLHVQCLYRQRFFGPPARRRARVTSTSVASGLRSFTSRASNESTAISIGGFKLNGLAGSSGGGRGSVGSCVSTSMPLTFSWPTCTSLRQRSLSAPDRSRSTRPTRRCPRLDRDNADQ